MRSPRIILASQSPRRLEILKGVLPPGTPVTVVSPGIDEKAIRHPHPSALTMAIARAKCEAVSKLLSDDAVVVTADTVAVCDGFIREKPADAKELRYFVKTYSNYRVTAVTSVWVHRTHARPGAGRYLGWSGSATDTATVEFGTIPPDRVESIVGDKAFYGSAGGFLIEHPLMKDLIRDIQGDPDTVQGLPGRLVKLLVLDALRST